MTNVCLIVILFYICLGLSFIFESKSIVTPVHVSYVKLPDLSLGIFGADGPSEIFSSSAAGAVILSLSFVDMGVSDVTVVVSTSP